MTALFAWLLTYLVHSTLLLGASWAAIRLLGESRLALQEKLLRFALVGALLTSALQVGLCLEPAAGRVSLAAEAPPVAALPAVRTLSPPAPEAPPPREIPWAGLLLAAWALGAGWSLLRLGVASLRLRHVLGSGRTLVEGALPRTARRAAAALGLARPVELRASARIAVPFAAGIRRPRVCLPERVLTDLGPLEQEGLCAHELAHLHRRDPEWVLANRIVSGALFFQPLNHWAARQLGELSECLSDELAARATGRAPELARSLVEVADWTTGQAALPAPTALRAPRGLGRRIDRLEKLMREPRPRRRTPNPDRGWLPLAAVALFAGTVLLPGVSDRTASAAPLPQEPAAPSSAEERELARIEERLEQAADERAQREEERRAGSAEVRAERERQARRTAAQAEHERQAEREAESSADEDASVEELERAIGHVRVEIERAAEELEAAMQLESAEIERALAESGPSQEELSRVEAELNTLGEEFGRAAQEHLEATQELQLHRQELREEQREQIRLRQQERREQMRQLRERMREQTERLRLSTEDRVRLRLRLGEEVRPHQDRLRELSRELQRLTRRLVRSLWADDRVGEPPEPPEPPEAPEAPEVPEVPEAPEAPEAPAVPEAAVAPIPPAPPVPPPAVAVPAAPAPPEAPAPPPAARKGGHRRSSPAASDQESGGLLPRLPVAV